MLVGVSHSVTAATPDLADFGYGAMRTNRTLHLAIILVNFTNRPISTDIAAPYPMGATLVGTNYAAAERYYTNWFFTVADVNPTVNGYLFEASNGRMGCTKAGLTMLTLDTNLNYASIAAPIGAGGTADMLYASNFLWLAAAKAGFASITNRDVNHDGYITDDECTLVLLSNDKTIGGGTRGPYTLPMPKTKIQWSAKFTFQDVTDTPLNVVNHELIHVMQGEHDRDIYGPGGALSYALTIMAGGREIVHPDAWHKMQLAWCEPRAYSMREAREVRLPATQLMRSNAPVVLYDPASPTRNTNEFFILEYRTRAVNSVGSGYDWQVAGNGLVVWHVRQDRNKNPLDYTQTYFPLAEQNWRRCANCFALFLGGGSNGRCPAGSPSHVVVDSHICLAKNDPSAEGVPGWRGCLKCGQLYYMPNVASSVCAAGGNHMSDTDDYRLRLDSDPEALGTRSWWHCGKCQGLFQIIDKSYGICPAGGAHVKAAGSSSYTLLWWSGLFTIMNAGAPDLARGRGGVWGAGAITPLLRYYDGAESRTRLVVHPFVEGDSEITVEVQPNYETWVDFAYTDAEEGSFEQPFDTFAEGTAMVYPGGILHLKTGVSPEARHVTKSMRIEAYGGPVTVGRR